MTRFVLAATVFVLIAAPATFADTVVITRDGCAALQRYVPAPDVNYQPGVDVNGNAVAPADLDGGVPPLKLPEDIHITLSVELQKRLGIPADPNSYKPETFLGDVMIKPDGRAYFNGQPLQDDAAYELAQLCQKQGNAPVPPRPPSRH